MIDNKIKVHSTEFLSMVRVKMLIQFQMRKLSNHVNITTTREIYRSL
jgi:hypothetical protein